MSRKPAAGERRRQILDAFGACINEKPYDAIGIRELAERSGIPYSSLYYYYKNKEEILLSYISERFHEYYDLLKIWYEQIPADFKAPTLREFLPLWAQYAGADLAASDANSATSSSMCGFWGMCSQNPNVQEIIEKEYDQYYELMERAFEKCGFHPDNPRLMAVLLMGMVDGMYIQRQVFPRTLPPDIYINYLADMMAER